MLINVLINMLYISGIIIYLTLFGQSWAFQPISTSTKRTILSARRSTSDRPRRQPPNRKTATSRRTTTPTEERKRAPHQFDHTKADARPFLEDPSAYVKEHNSPNEDAPYYKFDNDEDDTTTKTLVKEGSHIKSISLDDLFPGINFSEMFCSNAKFRDDIRNSMREDIFDSTPAYEGMSDKARKMLLLPDSSLQGSWNCKSDTDDQLRMKNLTKVLKGYLGDEAPTGDHFMQTVGSLCGSKPSTHWIDIVGIKDRKIDHSWHQDTGTSPNGDTYTVLLGFPKEDNYDGIGVFSHSVNLKYERVASDDHPSNEPVLYPGLEIDDKYIVKPRFAKGSEIVMFRDIDTLHSAPDVTYRTSVMRFM